MNEKQFQQQVRDLSLIMGWQVYHTWNSIHSPAGFPDVCLVRESRLIFAELKTDSGKITPAQQGWLDSLKKTKAEVYIWRPVIFNEIVEILR